jgi:exopolysaccharide biosynthesis protein
MKVKSTKSFICRTKENDVKMGTIEKISMLDVPDFIRKFGCIDAINLDNGGSLAMYDKNKYVV